MWARSNSWDTLPECESDGFKKLEDPNPQEDPGDASRSCPLLLRSLRLRTVGVPFPGCWKGLFAFCFS